MSETVIELYRAAAAEQPMDAAIRTGLAQAFLSAGQGQSALEAADAALQIDPENADAWQVRGQALGAMGKLAGAASSWERALAAAPTRAGLCTNLGVLCAQLDRVADAEHWLSRAIQLNPNLKEAHASLGALFACTGRPKLAEQYCLQALTLDPGLVAAHRNLAAVADSRGNRQAARRHWEAAFARQSAFLEPAYEPAKARTVLVPLVAGGGNVPLRHLFPRSRNTLIKWCVEHARPGESDQLPPYDLVFNAVGDPDEGATAAAPLATFLAGCKRPVLNLPDRVAATRRDRLPGLLGNLPGVVVPAVLRLGANDRPVDVAARAGLRCPLLIRPVGAHGGDGVGLIETEAALAALSPGLERYLTAFHDTRSADGLWRKYRAIFIQGEALPYHLAASDRWLVHYWTAGMESCSERREEERHFLCDPVSALGAQTWKAVRAIGQRIGLDWCGIDFARLPDGRVLVFEANATMSVHPEDEGGPFAYKNPAVAAILDTFEKILEQTAGARPDVHQTS